MGWPGHKDMGKRLAGLCSYLLHVGQGAKARFAGVRGKGNSTPATLPFAPFSKPTGSGEGSSLTPNEAQLPGLPFVPPRMLGAFSWPHIRLAGRWGTYLGPRGSALLCWDLSLLCRGRGVEGRRP